jgi:hypothetical protein
VSRRGGRGEVSTAALLPLILMARIEEGKLVVAMLRTVGGGWAMETFESVVEILRRRKRARLA